MATKAQLQIQLEASRREIERLEAELRRLQAATAGNSPGGREVEKRLESALWELRAKQEENVGARDEIRRLRGEAEKAQQLLDVATQQRDAATTKVRRWQQRVETLEHEESGREVLHLRKTLAESQTAAEAQRRATELEIQRLRAELDRQQQEGELLRFRALAEQQQKWEVREQQIREHLDDVRQQLQQTRQDSSVGEEWSLRAHELQGQWKKASGGKPRYKRNSGGVKT